MSRILNKEEKDQLKEVISMGAGNSSTVLSKMVNSKVSVSVPKLKVDKIENVPDFIGELEEIRHSVLLKITGKVPGIILLTFTPESALNLSGLLTGEKKNSFVDMSELDYSALKEVGNILSGASLTALSNFLNINLVESIPESATDMLGSIVDGVLAEVGQVTESILIFKVEFSVENKEVDASLFCIFSPSSTEEILKITKKKI